jgi:hypothetical protein
MPTISFTRAGWRSMLSSAAQLFLAVLLNPLPNMSHLSSQPTSNGRTHAIWAIVAVSAASAAFCAGYFTSTPTGAEARRQGGADAAGSPGHALRAGDGAGNTETDGAGAGPGGGLTGAQVKERIFQCLSNPDRVERMRLLCALLPLVTKENWRDVEEAFARQQSKEFRVAAWERELMLERLGQVLGGESVDEALAAGDKSRKGRAATLLRGWAGAEPAKAIAWFDTQKPEVQKMLLGEFVAGLALGDPKRAMEVLQRFGKDEKEAFLPWIVSNTLQRDGFQGTEQAFAAALANGSADGGAGGKVFTALATRRLEVAKLLGEPVNNLDWLDGYLRPDSPASSRATEMLVGDAAQRDAAGTAKWLDERDARLNPSQQKAAYLAVANSMVKAAPDQFVGWLGQHATHPQYNAMVQATFNGLAKQGKAEDAQKLVGNIQDEALRTKLQTSLDRQDWQSGAEGVRVEAKAGFMHSPFDPQARPIDVRGLPKGTEVEDPHHPGKTLIVP